MLEFFVKKLKKLAHELKSINAYLAQGSVLYNKTELQLRHIQGIISQEGRSQTGMHENTD